MQEPLNPPTLLVFVPCRACRGISIERWYGGFVCRSCAAFFKRCVRRKRHFTCKSLAKGTCSINKHCSYCRYKRCIAAGMQRTDVVRDGDVDENLILTIKTKLQPKVMAKMKVRAQLQTRVPEIEPVPRVCRKNIVAQSPTPAPQVRKNLEILMDTVDVQLLTNAKWMKLMLVSAGLSTPDQLQQVTDGWKNMLILSLAQCGIPIHLPYLATTFDRINNSPEEVLQFQDEVSNLQAVIVQLRTLKLDSIEYRALQVITMFKPTDDEIVYTKLKANKEADWNDAPMFHGKIDTLKLNAVLMRAESALASYVACTYPDQRARYASMINALELMETVSKMTVEFLFLNSMANGKFDISKTLQILHQNIPVSKFTHISAKKVDCAFGDECTNCINHLNSNNNTNNKSTSQ